MYFFKEKIDYSAALDDKRQGIPKEDLLRLSRKSEEMNIVLLIRPVEPLTKALHEQGTFPTKNFNIKGKSSSWGPWAGFIPVNQAYSKLSGADLDKISEAKKDVQNCINQGFAQATHLTITEKRFQELQSKGIIHLKEEKENEYLVIDCPSPHSSKVEICYAKKINVATGTEYAIYTDTKEPFKVLADMHLNKPLIADYDLLAIFGLWENYSRDNIRPNPDVTLRERYRKLSSEERRRSTESSESFYAREIQNLGNIAPKTIKIISELNKALRKGDHLECIHHNDDAGSPFSDPRANYPITALLPQFIKELPKIVLINSAHDFVHFIKVVNNYQYRIETNPLWEPTVQLAAKEDFYQKKFYFENKLNNLKDLNIFLRNMFKAIGLTDSTLIEEITRILLLIINQDAKTEFENLLNDEIFFKLQKRVTEIKKEDIPDFYELLVTIINFEDFESLQQDKSEEISNKSLNLAEKNSYNSNARGIKFKSLISKSLTGSLLNPTEQLRTPMSFQA